MAMNEKIKNFSLTFHQKQWLIEHGGRDEEDVCFDESGVLCIEMVKGRDKTIMVPIPQR